MVVVRVARLLQLQGPLLLPQLHLLLLLPGLLLDLHLLTKWASQKVLYYKSLRLSTDYITKCRTRAAWHATI